MSNASPSWYLPGEGKHPAGPFTVEQIVGFWRAGRISEKTVCWRDGMTQWLPLWRVEPFAAVMRPPPNSAAAAAVFSPPVSQEAHPPSANAPSPPTRSTGRLVAVSFAAVIGLAAIAVIVLTVAQGGRSRSRTGGAAGGTANGAAGGSDAALLAEIIADYRRRVNEAHESRYTAAQREETLGAAAREFRTRICRFGAITLTGRVAEVQPAFAGPGRLSFVVMDVPEELKSLVADGTCSFDSKLWVNLTQKDILSIHKGDPITLRGRVSYSAGMEIMPFADNCVALQVWPTDRDHPGFLGLGGMGQPHTVVIPVADNLTCSIGPFKSLPVLSYRKATSR
jgi:hypothetical protein